MTMVKMTMNMALYVGGMVDSEKYFFPIILYYCRTVDTILASTVLITMFEESGDSVPQNSKISPTSP